MGYILNLSSHFVSTGVSGIGGCVAGFPGIGIFISVPHNTGVKFGFKKKM